MAMYITQNVNTDNYLCSFISIKNLLNVAQVNKSLNILVSELKIMKQYTGFKTCEGVNFLADFACENNYLELIDHIYKFDKLKFTYIGLVKAAKNGHIEIFKWFNVHKNYVNIYTDGIYGIDETTILDDVLVYGHTNVYNWLINNDSSYEFGMIFENITDKYVYGEYVLKNNTIHITNKYFIGELYYIFKYGFVDALDQINKFDNDRFVRFLERDTDYYFGLAILNGDLQILKWFHINHHKYIFKYALSNMNVAIKCNRYSIIKWFVDNGYKFDNLNKLIEEAQNKNQIEIIKLLINS